MQTVISGNRQRSASEVLGRSERLASAFAAIGVGEDDVVALLLRNDVAFFEASLAAAKLGAYVTPINWHSVADEIAYILRDSRARILVAHRDLATGLDAATLGSTGLVLVDTPPEVAAAYAIDPAPRPMLEGYDWETLIADARPHDGALPKARGSMIYTSGTTGRPKGVRREPVDQTTAQRMQEVAAAAYGLARDGRPMTVLMTGPMYHTAPNSYGMLALQLGANVVLQPRFDAEALLELVERHRVTHMHMVPTMFHRLLALPQVARGRHDLSSLEYVVHGAAPCPVATKEAMIAWWGEVIGEYYGSTETGLITQSRPADFPARPGSVGRPLPGTKIRVLTEDGAERPAGETGMIYVRSGHMPSFGYHGQPERRAEIERDGFVTVGDIGHIDDEGYVHLSDRRSDIVVSGGVNLYPAEVEAALQAVPGVADCAVIGAPDPEFGERLIAFVQRGADGQALTADTIQAALRGRLSGFKIPREINFADTLPREDSGKIFKRRLRERYLARPSEPIPGRPPRIQTQSGQES